MIQFNEHLLVYSVIGHYILIHIVAPKRAVCFFVTCSQCNVKLPGLTCRILFFIRFFIGSLAGHQCHVFCLKTLKRANNITFETITYVKVLTLVKMEKKLEFNLILPIISILLKALRQIIQRKLGFITSAVSAFPLLTLRRKGNSYNNIVNSISILITTALLQALKKII